MARTPEITMDSEVIISDINMGVFKNELRVYPTYDYKDRKVKVGIYLNPYEKDEILEEEEPIKETHTQIKSIVGTKEEPTQELAWLNKYRR